MSKSKKKDAVSIFYCRHCKAICLEHIANEVAYKSVSYRWDGRSHQYVDEEVYDGETTEEYCPVDKCQGRLTSILISGEIGELLTCDALIDHAVLPLEFPPKNVEYTSNEQPILTNVTLVKKAIAQLKLKE